MGVQEIIPSTMGEPLLYEHFEEIIALCEEYNLRLNLTTNGTFPKGGARYWAEQVVPIGSDVKISINGTTPDTQSTIMVGANLYKVLENIRKFIQVRDAYAAAGGNRCRVTFQTTFLESNVSELPNLIRLAAEMGVDRVKGHHLWAHFDAIKGESMRRNAAAILHWNQIVRQAEHMAETIRLPNGQKVMLENIFVLDPDAREDIAPEGPCPFLGQEAWVSAEGRFDPCCAPDDQRRSLGSFGNLETQGLSEIWGGESYRHLLASYPNRALCRTCNMRKPREVS